MNSAIHFPAKETAVTIPGPAGSLEAIIAGPLTAPINKVAIVCHPHSLYGGTMTNKVVTTTVRAFRDLGFDVVRFNFRGVGNSTGQYDAGIGETDDVLAVMHWVEIYGLHYPLWLGGFSFGAYVAARAAAQTKIAGLVTIAPPVNHFDFLQEPIEVPWIVVQGEQDEIVSAAEVFTWLDSLAKAPALIRFPNATHFFHGQLGELRHELEKAVSFFI